MNYIAYIASITLLIVEELSKVYLIEASIGALEDNSVNLESKPQTPNSIEIPISSSLIPPSTL